MHIAPNWRDKKRFSTFLNNYFLTRCQVMVTKISQSRKTGVRKNQAPKQEDLSEQQSTQCTQVQRWNTWTGGIHWWFGHPFVGQPVCNDYQENHNLCQKEFQVPGQHLWRNRNTEETLAKKQSMKRLMMMNLTRSSSHVWLMNMCTDAMKTKLKVEDTLKSFIQGSDIIGLLKDKAWVWRHFKNYCSRFWCIWTPQAHPPGASWLWITAIPISGNPLRTQGILLTLPEVLWTINYVYLVKPQKNYVHSKRRQLLAMTKRCLLNSKIPICYNSRST